MIDTTTAIALLAELRAAEKPAQYHAIDEHLLQHHNRYIPLSKILIRAKRLTRERGAPWREWRGLFRDDLEHCLPAITYIN